VHRAKSEGARAIQVWGTGKPTREFLYVDDLADALVFLMKNYSGEHHVNVGTGVETSVAELAQLIARVAGWDGRFEYDRSKPDGMPRKVMDVSRLRALGWTARTSLEEGFRKAHDWYVRHAATREPQS
jgi:GDP-L-fucose synthase